MCGVGEGEGAGCACGCGCLLGVGGGGGWLLFTFIHKSVNKTESPIFFFSFFYVVFVSKGKIFRFLFYPRQ